MSNKLSLKKALLTTSPIYSIRKWGFRYLWAYRPMGLIGFERVSVDEPGRAVRLRRLQNPPRPMGTHKKPSRVTTKQTILAKSYDSYYVFPTKVLYIRLYYILFVV